MAKKVNIPVYNELEKKWYIDFDEYKKKLWKRLEKEKRQHKK